MLNVLMFAIEIISCLEFLILLYSVLFSSMNEFKKNSMFTISFITDHEDNISKLPAKQAE